MIFYHVRDPNSGANFDLYEIEYLMALKLDGIREIDEVIAEIQADYEFDISEDDFHTFMEQLSSLGFVRDLAEDGEGLDSAATQVFQVPVDNTQTQQFKIAETAALIDAGDTSHLAPKKPIPPKTIAVGVSAAVGVLCLILFILYSRLTISYSLLEKRKLPANSKNSYFCGKNKRTSLSIEFNILFILYTYSPPSLLSVRSARRRRWSSAASPSGRWPRRLARATTTATQTCSTSWR